MKTLKITVEELDTLLTAYPKELGILKATPDLQQQLDALDQPPLMGIASTEDMKRCMLYGLPTTTCPWPKAWTSQGL